MTQPFEELRRYADDLASEVAPFVAQRAVHRAMSPTVSRPRKALVALAVTGLLGVSNVALAATADPAVPGEALYGIDRAYEQVADLTGFGGPRVAERLQEAGILVEQGELAAALDLVQETLTRILEDEDPAGALAELEALAGEQPAVVAALVQTAKNTAASGQDVSSQARQLRELLSQQPEDAGPPDHAGGGPPDGAGGPPADAPGQQNRP